MVPVQKPSEQPGLGPPQKGVNCYFSSPELNRLYGVRKLSEQPGLGPPQKGVNCYFSSRKFDKPYGVGKLSILDAEYGVSAGLPKR